jgi:hypothetical protein
MKASQVHAGNVVRLVPRRSKRRLRIEVTKSMVADVEGTM